MISIFTPTTKVHMQRDVMRETDIRLVKYSQRGIFLSLFVFFAVMFVGDYYEKSPKLTIIMGIVLTLLSLIRGFFLYKFEYLYAQGPARWRNLFFCFSLIGSSWWGFIVAEITYVNGFYNETPVLWLYTAAFFAGSIYIFSPYERFLRIYMFVAFIPCSVTAIALLQPVSILYGAIMIALYLLLCRQGKIIGQNYWDKLQATYDLLQRANALEAEKITTQSSLDNQNLLFRNVVRELKSSEYEVLSSLQLIKNINLAEEDEKLTLLTEEKVQQQISLLKNVSELFKLSEKNIALEQETVDLCSVIEQSLSKVSLIAHKKNIEVYSSFSSDFPSRFIADNDRIEQLIGNMVVSACQFCDNGELIMFCDFNETSTESFVNISIINPSPIKTPETIEKINSAFSTRAVTDRSLGLNLAIIKGIVEAMQGNAGIEYNAKGELVINATLNLSVVNTNPGKNKTVKSLQGKKIMLYQTPKNTKENLQLNLESWGLEVASASDEDKVFNHLEEEKCDGIILYSKLDNMDSLLLSKRIANHKSLWKLPQIFALSQLQRKLPEVSNHFLKYVNIEVVYKPIEHRHLKNILKNSLNKQSPKKKELNLEAEDLLVGKNILLFQREEIDRMIVDAMLKKFGCNIIHAESSEKVLSLFENNTIDAFICESHLESVDMEKFIKSCREAIKKNQQNKFKPPILGLTSHEMDNEETQCLACGMEYYIDSPTNIEDLRAILRRFIGRSIYIADQTSSV